MNKSGGKAKKKWSKDRVWDQLNNLDLFDKLVKEVSNQKLTASLSSLRLRIHSSLARAAFQELLSKGLIKLVSKHRDQVSYNTKGGDAPATGKDAWTGPSSCTFWKMKLY